MTKSLMKMMSFIGLGALALLPSAHADSWNQKTVLTFSGPVEVPGQVLPAGTYVFKLHDSLSGRHIVQVFNKSENHVFGTFLAIPDYRMRPSSKPIVTFHERPAGSPEAIKSWFYPGKTYGHEFVYPKGEAVALAQANNTPVPAMPAELTADTKMPDLKANSPQWVAIYMAPLKAEKPGGEVVELADAFPTDDAPSSLPATATTMPLIGLIGLVSLGGALALRFASSRTH